MNQTNENKIFLFPLKNFETKIHNWLVENISSIEVMSIDNTTFAGIINNNNTVAESEAEESKEGPFEDLKKIIVDEIEAKGSELTLETFKTIFHILMTVTFKLLTKLEIRNPILINGITHTYLLILYKLKGKDPDNFSSLIPFQQFFPHTFKFIGDELAKDNSLVEIIDIDYWKDNIFKEISRSEENKHLTFSIRSFILFSNNLRNRKIRLANLKK